MRGLKNWDLVEKAGIAILIDDQDGNFKYANKRYYEMFGYSLEEMKNQSIRTLVHPDDVDRVLQYHYHRLKRKKAPSRYKFKGIKKDGSSIFLEMDVVPIKAKQRIIGTRSYIWDITVSHNTEDQVQKTLEKLRKALNATIDAIALTVEARDPFTSGHHRRVADLARSEAGHIEKDLSYLRSATDKMAWSLNEILEMSRIGRIQDPPVPITFLELVDDALTAVAGPIAIRGGNVDVSRKPVLLVGDRPRLVQIWQNFVENAVKFMGDQPAPRIEIGVERRESETVFSVRENGMGIPSRFQARVFGLFEKADPQSAGTGLGLAFVERIVELDKGTIQLESKGLGQGACFRFTLPAALGCSPEGEPS